MNNDNMIMIIEKVEFDNDGFVEDTMHTRSDDCNNNIDTSHRIGSS